MFIFYVSLQTEEQSVVRRAFLAVSSGDKKSHKLNSLKKKKQEKNYFTAIFITTIKMFAKDYNSKLLCLM